MTMNQKLHFHSSYPLIFFSSLLLISFYSLSLSETGCRFLYSGDGIEMCTRCTKSDCTRYCEHDVNENYCTASLSCSGGYVIHTGSCNIPTSCTYNDCDVCTRSGCIWTESGCSISGTPVACLSPNCNLYKSYDECTNAGSGVECKWYWEAGARGPKCYEAASPPVSGEFLITDSTFGHASGCEFIDSCADCVVKEGCGWCKSDTTPEGYCIIVLDSPNDLCTTSGFSHYNDCNISTCKDYNENCDTCTQTEGCMWCDTDDLGGYGQCIDDTDVCNASDRTVTSETKCPAMIKEECEGFENCSDCIAVPECDWCLDDTALKTGSCMFKSINQNADQCKKSGSGEFLDGNGCYLGTCGDYENDCSGCQNDFCTYCYDKISGKNLCLPVDSDCTNRGGDIIEDCTLGFSCYEHTNCDECFTEFPFCQWRYYGENYSENECVDWDYPKPEDSRFLDVITCPNDDIVACELRTGNCNDCILADAEENMLTCLWCGANLESGKCVEYGYEEEGDFCVIQCYEQPEPIPTNSYSGITLGPKYVWITELVLLSLYIFWI